jgi:hypothetical protein
LTINRIPNIYLSSDATDDEICTGESITFTATSLSTDNGLNFTGVDDEIVITGASQFNIGASSDLLFEAVINTSNTTSGNTIFSKMTSGTNVVGAGYQIWVGASGVLFLEWGINGGGNISNSLYISGNTVINDGLCHNVKVEVLRSDSTINLYVDGVLDATVKDAKVIGNADNTANVLIGAERSNNSVYNFNGDIFNVMVTIGGNVIGLYNFDQGTPGGSNSGITTLVDNSGNGNDGTLQGFTLTGNSSNWVSSSCSNPSSLGNFEFFVNGTSQGTASAINTFTSSSITNGQVVSVEVTNGAGCSKSDSITVTVNSPTSSSVTASACDSYTWIQNGMTYNTSGMYNDTIPNAVGCDSVITLDLTIDENNVSVNVIGDSIVANNSNADAYQWVICNSNGSYTAIAGATNQGFSPDSSANYAVVVTQGACVDTSVCSEIIVTGIDNVAKNSINLKIYPNPTNSQFVVEIDDSAIGTPIRIIDFSGKLIREEVIQNAKTYYSGELAAGVYFIHVGNEYQKLIITQ